MAGPGPLQNIPPQEQLLVERAIGAAVFDKLRGNPASLVKAYQTQGGSNQTSVHALTAIDEKFQTWDISAAGHAAAKTASTGSFNTAYQHWGLSHAELGARRADDRAGVHPSARGRGSQLHRGLPVPRRPEPAHARRAR